MTRERRWHVHGSVRIGRGREAWVSVSVDAETDEQAQRYAWLVVPELDVDEIEPAPHWARSWDAQEGR